MKRSLLIGLTGSIGAGKSTIASIFSILGIPVYNADYWAKQLMVSHAKLKDAIIKAFGRSSYTSSGELNRSYLAEKVFSDPKNRDIINSLVHPQVGVHFQQWVKQQDGFPYLIKEAALLLEPNLPYDLDEYVVVCAPEALRLSRVQQRDSYRTKQEILDIMSLQSPQQDIVEQADFTINNDGTQLVLPQVLNLHVQFKLQTSD